MKTHKKNFLFIFFLILSTTRITLNQKLYKFPQKSFLQSSINSFIDESDELETKKELINAKSQIDSNFIEESEKKSNPDKSRNLKKQINEKLDETTSKMDEIEGLFGTTDKKLLKKKMKKIMMIYNDIITDEDNGKQEEDIPVENSKQKINNDFSILDAPKDDIIEHKPSKKVNIITGQGKTAKNLQNEWDKINIFDISNWPDLCKYGFEQSPIRINLSQNHYIEPFKIDIDYGILKEEYLEIYNDGFKLFLKGNFGTIKYGDHNFKVSEIHLHHPSEHTFGENELRTDMEIQIINQDKNGQILALSVFLHNFEDEKKDNENEIRDSQKFLRNILELQIDKDEEVNLDDIELLKIGKKRKIPKNDEMDLSLLIKNVDDYISYEGSLTSPPCTEGVKWIIVKQKNYISSFEIKAFQKIFGKETNVRGLQDLRNRKIRIF